MDIAKRLMELKDDTVLLDGEVHLEGWAAERSCSGRSVRGLAMVTNWRIVFADVERGMSAIPIDAILSLNVLEPAGLLLTAWHDQMRLTFDGRPALRAVVDLLRQAPAWDAVNRSVARSARPTDVRVWSGRVAVA